jgi:hypothetical protein
MQAFLRKSRESLCFHPFRRPLMAAAYMLGF